MNEAHHTPPSEACKLDEVVRRRMSATGEGYAVALQTILAIHAAVLDADQSWIHKWCAPAAWVRDDAAIDWLRARPRELWPLMRRFPPSCVVRPLVSLMTPAPGTFGILQSWHEPTDRRPNGRLGIVQSPASSVRAECLPDHIEAVAYWRGWTPERVREVLAGASRARAPHPLARGFK